LTALELRKLSSINLHQKSFWEV